MNRNLRCVSWVYYHDIGYFLCWRQGNREADGLLTSYWWSVTGMIAVESLLISFPMSSHISCSLYITLLALLVCWYLSSSVVILREKREWELFSKSSHLKKAGSTIRVSVPSRKRRKRRKYVSPCFKVQEDAVIHE